MATSLIQNLRIVQFSFSCSGHSPPFHPHHVHLVMHTQRSRHQPLSLASLLGAQQQLNRLSQQPNISLVKEIGRT